MKILQTPEDVIEKQQAQEELLEISRSMGQARMQKLYSLSMEASKNDFYHNIDFYVVIVPTLDPNTRIPEDRVFFRRSCPTPAYNQHVFKYHKETGMLEFLWSIPKKLKYYHLLQNKDRYLKNPTLKSRTSFVVLMETGELEKWVKQENKEEPGKEQGVIKINKTAHA